MAPRTQSRVSWFPVQQLTAPLPDLYSQLLTAVCYRGSTFCTWILPTMIIYPLVPTTMIICPLGPTHHDHMYVGSYPP
jgi:hypothetical protein